MSLADDAELIRLKSITLDGMRGYMVEAEVSYTEEHIQACERILNDHLAAIAAANDSAAAGEARRRTVESFNALNVASDYELIETDQRETICAFIIRAGALAGFNEPNEDVTEDWREW